MLGYLLEGHRRDGCDRVNKLRAATRGEGLPDVLDIIHKALRNSEDERIHDATRVQYKIEPGRTAEDLRSAEVVLTTNHLEGKKMRWKISLLGIGEDIE